MLTITVYKTAAFLLAEFVAKLFDYYAFLTKHSLSGIVISTMGEFKKPEDELTQPEQELEEHHLYQLIYGYLQSFCDLSNEIKANNLISESEKRPPEQKAEILAGYESDQSHVWNKSTDKINQAIEGLQNGKYKSLREASLAMGFSKGWLNGIKQNKPDIAERIEEACASPAFEATRLEARKGNRHPSWNKNIDKVDRAIEGLKNGEYKSLKEASLALGFSESWLNGIKQRKPDIAERIEEACASPAFEATRLEARKGNRHWDWDKSMDKINQAIEGLETGLYDSLAQACRALGFSESWLTSTARRRPDIAERLEKARSSPAFEVVRDPGSVKRSPEQKAEMSARNKGDRSPVWNKNIDKIDRAIEGLKNGEYKNLKEASLALGFNGSWLTSIARRKPDIAKRIEEACASPAFEATRLEARKGNRHYSWKKNIDKIDRAIEGLKNGEYKNLVEASRAMGFNGAWLNNMKLKKTDIAKRIEEACVSPAFKAARLGIRKGDQSPIWNKNIDKVDRAIEGLQNGEYKSLKEASLALGFSENWLAQRQRTRPDIAERIEKALLTKYS